jgi:hypothetical protein
MSLLRLSRARPEPAPGEPEPVGPPDESALAQVELYTVWGREVGWVSSGRDRTSDWLNQGDTISVRGLRDLPLAGNGPDAEPAPTLAEADALPMTERLAADVIFVVPPALSPNRHLRLHRRIVAVRMELASFRLVGRVHIRPGAEAGDYLLRGNRRFVPVTGVELTHTGEPSFARQLPVAIINVTHVMLLDRGAHAETHEEAHEGEPSVEAGRPRTADDALGALTGTTQDSFLSARVALEQLAALADEGLITRTEQRRKRAEILARI